jgi:phosphocarrier protein FPr/phosphocarrier protein
MAATGLILQAPVRGRIVALDAVPDPMFALGMMGDGLAIEPELGEVRAPCPGKVISVHRRGHAVKLVTGDGAEILVHVGLEAVALRGAGFRPMVREGQTVAPGDLLVTFDLAGLTAACGIVTTPVLVANDTDFHVIERREAGEVDFGMPLFTVAPVSVAAPPKSTESAELTLEIVEGLHARPAALLAAAAKAFASSIEIGLDGRKASAKSPVSLLTLGSRWGSRLTVVADGPDAAEALAAVVSATR